MDLSPSGPGRRSNGLSASSWGALVDLDPRLSEALLGSLAAAGVPAYVEPATSLDAFSRAALMPARPLDRLWVDPVRADAARTVVAEEMRDLTTLLAEQDPGATAHGFVQPVPRTAASRVLAPPVLPGPAGLPGLAGSADEATPFGSGPAGTGPLESRPPESGPAESRPPVSGPAESRPPVSGPAEPRPPVSGPADAGPAESRPAGLTPADAGPAAEPAPAHESSTDPDEAWRRIVADFGRDAEHPVPPWPVSEDVDPPSRTLFPGRSGDPGSRRRRQDPPPVEQALPGWVEPDAVDDDGHYVPPPAPPVPRLAPRKLGAVAAVLAGLLLLFVPSVLDAFALAPSGVFGLGMLLVLGGAGSLVFLMRDAPPTDSGPDDGAVV